MKVVYTLSEDDYIAFNLFYARHDPAFIRRVRLLQCAGAGALIALGLAVGAGRSGVTPGGMALFLLAALLFVLYVPNQEKSTIEKWVRRMVDKKADSLPMGERTIFLSDDELKISDASGEQKIPLSGISSTVRAKKHLFLTTAEKEVVVIPLAAFDSPDDEQAFYSALPNGESPDR